MTTYIVTKEELEQLKDLLITEDYLIDKWTDSLSNLDTNKAYTVIFPKVNPEDYL